MLRPKIFLSSTRRDLGLFREAAKSAIGQAQCTLIEMDQWPVEDSEAVDLCMRKVDSCDALVVVVGKRYGWIPKGREPWSITWLEVKRAREKGIPVLAFVMNDGVEVDPQWDDRKQVQKAVIEMPPNFEELVRSVRQLDAFKAELCDRVAGFFSTPDKLESLVSNALWQWKHDRAAADREAEKLQQKACADGYLEDLIESTRWIDIRGLTVGGTSVYRAGIEQLYVTLKTAGTSGKEMRGAVPLEDALGAKRLVIQGDAGSGKTTFLRKMANELASNRAGGFPLWIRIAALEEHMAKSAGVAGTPLTNSAKWIPHYLGAQTKLTETVAEEVLKGREGVLFLDGFDEAPNDVRRRGMAKLLADAARSYPECRIVVTTRPAAYQGDAVLAGFETVRIEELDDEGVNQFLELWSGFLYPGNGTSAAEHQKALRRALDGKPEIKRLARNPVMLTALAVLQQNNRVLPELRAELYESIVEWLAKAREEKPGRMGAVQCLAAMGKLAWAMHTGGKGRVTQLGRPEAGRLLGFGDGEEALSKLGDEELDSGILARRGNEVAFWHLTFQEYLAARELAGKRDEEQYKQIYEGGRLYLAEWRETMLLYAGVLGTKQSCEKVAALFEEVTKRITDQGGKGKFAEKARCVGLLAAMAADLRPLKFEPDCEAYKKMVKEMSRLFEKEGAKGLDLATRVAAAEALGVDAHPAIYLPGDERYWVSLPGGEITLGATTKVATVKPFQLGRNPVTVWEYAKFVEEGGPVPDEWEEQLLHPTRPVVRVSWHDAEAYCKWAGCRLATEEEWEFAARGKEGREWAWGYTEPTDAHANIERWVRAPSPVGMFPDGNTPDGLVDMSGNVWEWTSSLYRKGDKERVLRGGSWFDGSHDARGAFRSGLGPGERSNVIGFRSARTKS